MSARANLFGGMKQPTESTNLIVQEQPVANNNKKGLFKQKLAKSASVTTINYKGADNRFKSSKPVLPGITEEKRTTKPRISNTYQTKPVTKLTMSGAANMQQQIAQNKLTSTLTKFQISSSELKQTR